MKKPNKFLNEYYVGYCSKTKKWSCYYFTLYSTYEVEGLDIYDVKQKLNKLIIGEKMGKLKNADCQKCGKWIAECTCDDLRDPRLLDRQILNNQDATDSTKNNPNEE